MNTSKIPYLGFTLIELIMVMVITGILSAVVAVFLRTPVEQYVDVAQRAELTDIADTALRRIGRDLRLAVPNSIRVPVTTGATYIEFLPTKTGGRYRVNAIGGTGSCSAVAGNSNGDALSFEAADSCFEIMGQAITFAANDWLVVGSTQPEGNLPYNSTASGILRGYIGTTGAQTTVKLTALQLPASARLDSQRFDIISGDEQAVTYACNNLAGGVLDANGDGQGELRRYWVYGFNAAQVAPALLIGSTAMLADKLSDCSIDYNTVNQRNGLVTIRLRLSRAGESVSLYSEIHIINLP